MAKILIKNGRVWNGEQFLFADVLTDGNKVAKIETDISDNADYVYDAKGKTVSSGLVDIHIHMRAHPTDKFGIQAEVSSFPFGVTCAADAGRTRGETALFDLCMLKNVVFVNAYISNNRVNFDKLYEALTRFGERAVGIKVYFDSDASEIFDVAPLIEVCRFARERKLIVMVHSTGSPAPMSEILKVLGEGDILTHAFHGGRNNAAEDGFASLIEAKKRGIVIDGGFAGHVHTDFQVLRGAIVAGALPDTISTDITKLSAYTRGGRYGMTMCMSIARHLGMSETDIFKSVTVTAAKALGKENEWGSLKVGGAADIAVFDYTDEGFSLTDKAGNHIESQKGYRCLLTVCDGQAVYRY